MTISSGWKRCASLLLLGSGWAFSGVADAQEFKPRIIELRGPAAQSDVLIQVNQQPKHWIGLYCRPVEESLRKHLKLPGDAGLLVDGVAPESPAAKCGLQQFDILLSLGGEKLKDPAALMQLVDKTGEQEITLEIIRQGKKQTVKVTPAARPEPEAGEAFQLPLQNLDTLRMWVERLDDPGHGELHLRGFGPGVMFAPRALPKLPEGVSIQIKKTGSEPTEVVVTRGEENWELSDKPEELAKLPEELRPAVMQMLGQNPTSFQMRLPGPGEGPGQVMPLPPGQPGGPEMEKRLQAIEQRLEEILKALSASPEK